MKKLIFILSALLFMIGTTDVQAQWIKKLGKKATESAKRATERNVERKVEKTVDKAFDGAEDAVTGKGNKDKGEKKAKTSEQGNVEAMEDGGDVENKQQTKKSAQMSWNKFDFVAGDEIIFEDNLAGEQLGEFPSMWDMVRGNAEIAQMDGENTICLIKTSYITPLMKNPKEYLPESFTIELDFYLYSSSQIKEGQGGYTFYLKNQKDQDIIYISFYGYPGDKGLGVATTIKSNGENRSMNDVASNINKNGWNHLSISFNKRALKVYINETRIANAPNVDQASWLVARGDYTYGGGSTLFYLKNVRIAKGAVPLYDRMMTDGKFVTYGITFDVGKSTIKPESMGEINRIVKLMTDNPDLKFSVEGHTDSTGNEASNQTLSEARSKAIVDKLAELGIAADRLSASGKGQTTPIADNSTDEGRAKNRRVEFVKI